MRENENILNYNGSFWFKITFLSFIVLIVSYIVYAQNEPNPSGATPMGLLYGILGLAAILLLMYYGIRKRKYVGNVGTLKGWLSFHIYIGVLTLLIVPMHAGFKFDLNVHTLAFALMAVVVISGIFGGYFYVNFPIRFTKQGGELLYDKFDDEINKLIGQMRALAKGKSALFAQKAEEAISYGLPKGRSGWGLVFGSYKSGISESEYMNRLQKDLTSIPEAEREDYQRLAVAYLQKAELQKRFVSQMRIKNLLEAWLHIHLPVSFAMLIALTAHIVSMLYYNSYRMFLPD
ncbi:MAG: hypothetical protein ACT4NX_05490 [Deltaproteobacteria bacterium]